MTRVAVNRILASLLLALAGGAAAQTRDDQPAVQTTPATGALPPAPAAPTPGARPAGPAAPGGTTIIGERESPIGLYITPWRNAAAEADIDRPARLLRVEMTPLDRKVFARQIEYYEALSAALKAKAAPAPAAAAPGTP